MLLDQIPEYDILTIDGSGCNFIDYILEIMSEYHNKAHDKAYWGGDAFEWN